METFHKLYYKIKRSLKLDSFDLLIIMGSSIEVYDSKENPWMKDEKTFIEQVIEARKPILGICLGAQLLTDILGVRVYENKHMEIG